MAVPKRKTSKQRANTRYAQWKLDTPNLGECKHCKSLIPQHKVCPECGYYDGVQVVKQKEKKAD